MCLRRYSTQGLFRDKCWNEDCIACTVFKEVKLFKVASPYATERLFTQTHVK